MIISDVLQFYTKSRTFTILFRTIAELFRFLHALRLVEMTRDTTVISNLLFVISSEVDKSI